MTILTSFILVVLIILAALFIAYNVQKGTKTLQEFKDDYYDNEQVQQVADLATELYNKELRPVAPRKTIKNIELNIEVTSEDITPQVIEKAVEIAKVLPEQATLNVEPVVKSIDAVELLSNLLQDEIKKTTEEVPAKPKKKRKYHSKAPKGKA
jgi:hypothetical protein